MRRPSGDQAGLAILMNVVMGELQLMSEPSAFMFIDEDPRPFNAMLRRVTERAR